MEVVVPGIIDRLLDPVECIIGVGIAFKALIDIGRLPFALGNIAVVERVAALVIAQAKTKEIVAQIAHIVDVRKPAAGVVAVVH